ncbi:MAG: tyrosine/phenylalanine carboxypeptidase domain-containing protein [Candidatus Woesearchaeota archaeon]
MTANKEIDIILDKISQKTSFFAINPTNEVEEKKKFFRSNKYEPQFKYEPYKDNIEKMQERLSELSPDNTTLGKLLKQSVNLNYAMLNMLKYRESERFTRYSVLCYGLPEKWLVKEAKRLLKTLKPKKDRKELTTKQIITRMKYAFFKYGFSWNIKEKDMAASAAVKVAKKELLIKKDEKYSSKFLKRLIVHEIGTHIVRAENGGHQPFRIFERGLPNYLMTEEGLAVVNEEINNCLDNAILRRYAARVVAVDMAQKYGFRKVYNTLRKYLDKELAWRTTVRVKRGLGDTSKPGGCTKDFAYLHGYYAVKKFIEEGKDINKLYYGKVGVQHVDLLDKIPDLIEPEYLPAFRYLKYFVEHFEDLLRSIIVLDIPPFNITYRLIKNNLGKINFNKLFNGNKR